VEHAYAEECKLGSVFDINILCLSSGSYWQVEVVSILHFNIRSVFPVFSWIPMSFNDSMLDNLGQC
jgi:hypothetical protein